MTSRRKAIVPVLLTVAIAALAFSTWFFQGQTTDAQKQVADLQNQLISYENSTSTLQTQVDSLETQLHDLQNQTHNVRIENVTSSQWGNLVGLAVDQSFFIAVKNIGVRDVGGLVFEFKILVNGTVWDSPDYEVGMISPEQFGVLHVQESRVVRAELVSHVGVSFAGKTLAITVTWDNTVLDEKMVPLSSGYG